MSEKVMTQITDKAKKAAKELALLSPERKNEILLSIAEALDSGRSIIKEENDKDIAAAEKNGKNAAFIDRLTLSDKRIDGMCSMMRDVAGLTDPVGAIIETAKRPNGLIIEKVRVPIGVIGIIYESRPNVTADCAALCLKSGNSVILRGGSDAINSNKVLYKIMKEAASQEGCPDGAFILIEDTSRKLIDAMLKASEGIDLIMPRGGESLIRQITEFSRIPVIKHYKGICHIYVDSEADLRMADEVCFNAKVQRPGVCNAMETMLVHEKAAEGFLPAIADKFIEAGVILKADPIARGILADRKTDKVTEEDYETEYLDLILNVRVVKSLDEAIEHIARFGSDHSDAIVTKNVETAKEFTKRVDSACVYVNASTRFTDGGEFGKGAEIGISTDRLHARGPMGLEELTTYKYVVHGHGQIRT